MNSPPPHDQNNPLLQAPVTRVLLSMSAPIGLGMLSTFLFQVVDTYFVGQLGGDPLAALGFAATTYFLAVALFMGMAVGVSALVGNALGQKDRRSASRYTTIASMSAVVLAVALSAGGILTLKPLFTTLGAGPELIPLIDVYMSTLYFGFPLLIFGLVGNAALSATGDTTFPAILMGIAGVINAVFDYLLIFGIGPFPELGFYGASLATVGSWVFVAVSFFVFLVRRKLLTLRVQRPLRELRDIVRLSTPAITTQILLPLTAMLITYLAAQSGPEVVAAFGVAQRVETLALVGISSVTVAIVPFVAQNFGAQELGRVDEAIAFAGKTSMYWGGGLFLLLVICAQPIAAFFSEDPTIIAYTTLYFYIVALSCAPYGIVMVTSSIFNGVQVPERALKVLLVKTFAFTIPLALLGSFFGATGIFASIALSNIFGAIYAARIMQKSLREASSKLADRSPLQGYLTDWRTLLGAKTRP